MIDQQNKIKGSNMEKSLDGTKRIISKERLGQNAWGEQRVGGGHKAGETLESLPC